MAESFIQLPGEGAGPDKEQAWDYSIGGNTVYAPAAQFIGSGTSDNPSTLHSSSPTATGGSGFEIRMIPPDDGYSLIERQIPNYTPICIYAEGFTVPTTEGLVSLIKNTAGSVAAGANSVSPGSTRHLCIQSIISNAIHSSTTKLNIRCSVRVNLSAAATVTSDEYFKFRLSSTHPTAVANQSCYPFMWSGFGGFLIPNGAGLAVSAVAATASAPSVFDITMLGYEFTTY